MFAEQKSSLKSPSVHLKSTFGKLDDSFSRNAGKLLLKVQKQWIKLYFFPKRISWTAVLHTRNAVLTT